MDAKGMRRAWTEFFAAKQHTIVPSDSLIPTHPSAPMFTNSGMMPFVPYFLGEEAVPFRPPRAASIQRCVRAGGKHNDLDAIGRTDRHLSFFEMLGNFSFGDYFKVEAITWAWELLTEVLGLDGDRLWITAHVSDDEAAEIWRDVVGVPAGRIQRMEKDNFWEMGDVGPCGPSSEIFWDHGPEHGPDGGPANPIAEDRYVEIWNLVFTQYFRQPGGELTELATKNIDTGAGLERMLTALNRTHRVFDVDPLDRLVEVAQSVTGRRLGESARADVGLRLLADHARTMTFLVSDGVVPSNEDRGYVLRRIIRRAVRYADLLGAKQDVGARLAEAVVDAMGEGYPELVPALDRIAGAIEREESRFRRTLVRGTALLEARLADLREGDTLPGALAFDLYETYGFPLELTQEISAEAGVEVDEAGYQEALARAQAVSRARARSAVAGHPSPASFQQVLDAHGRTEFTGREEYESTGSVLAVIPGEGEEVSIFLNRTPFYAEAGGQVGDTGTITTATGRAEVFDTTLALPGLHRHHARVAQGALQPGQEATARIDGERRDAIRRSHTGTHIVHWALREVVGQHVKQQGSWVGPDRLRFDFGPSDALSEEQIRRIEDLANAEILRNEPARHYETTKDHAMALGAIAFFGEKYGEVVRVLEAGRSIEFCGGTHVARLGDIGSVKIVSESSIGSNLRRLEAISGAATIERLRDHERALRELAELANVAPAEVVEGVRRRLEEAKALRKQLEQLRREAAAGRALALAPSAVQGVVVARVDGAAPEVLREMALALRDAPGIRAVVLGGAPDGGGAALVATVAPGAGLDAAALLEPGKALIRGGGGRDPLLAVAGGKEPAGIDGALERARAVAGLA